MQFGLVSRASENESKVLDLNVLRSQKCDC